jgi:preprotein translocase subunit SecD
MRPRIYLEGTAPIPVFDEYDFINIQLGTVDNIFSDDANNRIYALWFSFDRRSAMALQNITVRNIGKRLQLSIRGQLVGIHPIEKTISNGILPFILSETLTQESAALLYNELGQSLVHIRAELNDQK